MNYISYDFKDNTLFIKLGERLETSNAEATENEINEVRAQNPLGNVVLDAENLKYISSAGLRVILRLKKKEKDLKIINVSIEVYEIFDMTGFSEMITIEKAFRKMSVDGCKILGKGAKGIVYKYNDDTIVKVYKSNDCLPEINRERKLARKAFILGVPTSISFDVVLVGDKYGSVFELLDAASLSEAIVDNPNDMDKYVKQMADLMKIIHETPVKPTDMPNANEEIGGKWIESAKAILDKEDGDKAESLIKALPAPLTMLHCDFHTNNIMLQNGEALMIDMDTLSYGHPIFDLADTYFAYVGLGEISVPLVENFLGMKKDVYSKIWPKFLKLYLNTTDEARIQEANDKIKCINTIHMLRYVYKHRKNEPTFEAEMAKLKKEAHEYLSKTNSLDF